MTDPTIAGKLPELEARSCADGCNGCEDCTDYDEDCESIVDKVKCWLRELVERIKSFARGNMRWVFTKDKRAALHLQRLASGLAAGRGACWRG